MYFVVNIINDYNNFIFIFLYDLWNLFFARSPALANLWQFYYLLFNRFTSSEPKHQILNSLFGLFCSKIFHSICLCSYFNGKFRLLLFPSQIRMHRIKSLKTFFFSVLVENSILFLCFLFYYPLFSLIFCCCLMHIIHTGHDKIPKKCSDTMYLR